MFGAKSVRLIKPSQANEAWVGFDQGWVSTSESDESFVNGLKDVILGKLPPRHYFALLRQYKRVEMMHNASSHTPYRDTPGEWSTPYYRAALDTELPRAKIGATRPLPKYSQHMALVKLSELAQTDVQYICPMLFSPLDVWATPSLADVRMVSVKKTVPTFEMDTQKHHICFKNLTDTTPEYHSEKSHETASISFETWINEFKEKQSTMQLSAHSVAELLFTMKRILSGDYSNESMPDLQRAGKDDVDQLMRIDNISKVSLASHQSNALTLVELGN